MACAWRSRRSASNSSSRANILLYSDWCSSGFVRWSFDFTSAIARVTVARPLDEARIARLKTALTAQVGGPVNLQISVDPAVLGGISVAIDDDVYESTVAARLEDARRQLINL